MKSLRKVMAAVLALGVSLSFMPGVPGKAADAEGTQIKNSVLQVVYSAEYKMLGVSFEAARPASDEASYDEDPDSYEIQVAQDAAMTKKLQTVQTSGVAGSALTEGLDIAESVERGFTQSLVKKLPAGKTYYVRVRGIFNGETGNITGPWSKVQKVAATMKQKVKKLKIKKKKSRKIKISWAKAKKPKGAKKVFYCVDIKGKGESSSDYYLTAKTSLSCKVKKGKNVVRVIPYFSSNGKMELPKKKAGAYCMGKIAKKSIKVK